MKKHKLWPVPTVMMTALCGTFLFAEAAAQPAARNYPSRPVRIVVPYAPGGSSDTTARILGEKLRELLGQQFVIDNRPGAAGSIGRELVVKAAPDGYTLLVGDSPHTINVHVLKHVPYDPIRDFTPISLLATAPQVMVVHPGFTAKTLKEFVAAARAQPGRLNYGSGGSGSVTHMTGELFKLATGANIVHVPYKSIALASADVIAGQMHAAFPTAPGIVGHVRGGRMRALAISTAKRSSALPEVPTFEESGVAGMDVFNWFGVFGPARLPKDTLARLHQAVLDAMQSPDVRARFANLSLDIATTTPQEFGAHLKSELDRWGKVVKAAGIKAE
jgi:tripartite-type tricarboxylate transporter receptor subunit TctC